MGPALVELRGISKRFPGGTLANRNVDLELRQGEILVVEQRWMPRLVLRAGRPVNPSLRLVRDVTSPAATA